MDYEFPYGVLAFTKASNEITERHLKKLGMTYVDYEWIMAGEQPTTANVNQMEEKAKEEARQKLAQQ